MNSLIRYFGGKNGMCKQILDYFPNKDNYDTYIEPFGGSFAVALHNPNVPPIEIYNDLDNNVYALFKVLVNDELFAKFQKRCDCILYCEELRREFMQDLKELSFDESDEGLVWRALMFFYVNRTSRNGIGGFSVNTIVRRGMSKSCSDMLSAIERLPELHDRLSKVIVSHQDGIKLIEKYYDRDNVFIYCDPPYHQSTRTETRYNVDMDDEQQKKFIDTCLKAKCKLLISGYDCELYRKLEENGFKKHEFTVHTLSGDMKTKKDKVECLWYNYDTEKD